jgi:type IV pilus biogenesis protein PilP
MGVNLWQQSRSGEWLGLGFVPDTAENFSQAIEDLRMGATRQNKNVAEIRIAKCEVYFTKIAADRVPEKLSDQAILNLVAERIPFRDKSVRMVVDTCLRASGDLAVAIVPAAVLESAAEFAKRHGFVPGYFTTLNNPMMFPAEPRFRLVEPTRPMPALKPVRRGRNGLAAVAIVTLATLGLARIGQSLLASDDPVFVATEAGMSSEAIDTVMVSEQLPALQLQVLGIIANGSVGPTPIFAADIATPRSLPNAPTLIAVAAEDAASDPKPTASQERRTAFRETQAVTGSGFDSTGLTTRTRRLLNNSLITIEGPEAGGIGRKTIRILPSHPDQGSHNRRFDTGAFVRVAQVQTANDASGLPDVDNPLLKVTEDGVPLFKGAPDAVPPPRPNAAAEASDDGLEAFSAGIAQVLDGPDAAAPLDTSGIRVQKASLGTIRPRPNPFLKQPDTVQAKPDSTYPVQTASATTLRPKPRPASLVRKLQQRDINAAAELAAKEAIRENMPTEYALFVSLVPKPRPANMQKLVDSTRPGLTTAKTRSKAVVRTAPAGGGSSSGTMTTSKTPKSVAALATESARISKKSLSLIGIFGTSSARRALLRLPSGRYIKVKQGDDVGGWQVSAIGESSVRIKKGSRDEVLRMPK